MAQRNQRSREKGYDGGGFSARTPDIGALREVPKEVEKYSRLDRSGGVVLAPGHSLKCAKRKIEVMRRT